MRASRVGQDTARLIAALSSRRTLRSAATAEGIEAPVQKSSIKEETEDVDAAMKSESSSLSPPPSDMNDAFLSTTPYRKRKRHGVNTKSADHATILQAIPTARKPSKSKSSTTTTTTDSVTVARKPRHRSVNPVNTSDPSIPISPPPHWEEVYSLTREMRSQWPAPVDTMGCESLAEEHREPQVQRFQTLVALMLSSQTKDTVTAAAMKNMQENLPGGLTLASILAVDPVQLNDLIGKVGFHNTKTKHLKQVAEILRDRFNCDIPSTITDLVSLPGVGPKMAYLTMSAAWGRDEGIGVDVHVHRITNLWGWHETKTPEETRKTLEKWLPREKWHDINGLLVGFGQTWCPPVGRKCGECKLAERRLCPSAVVEKKVRSVKREVKGEDEVLVKEESNNAGELEGMDVRPKTEVVEEVIVERPVNEVDALRQILKSQSGEDKRHTDIKPALMEQETPDMEDIGRPARGRRTRVKVQH